MRNINQRRESRGHPPLKGSSEDPRKQGEGRMLSTVEKPSSRDIWLFPDFSHCLLPSLCSCKILFILHCPDEGQLPFSFSPNQTSTLLIPLNGQGLCGTHRSHQTMTLFPRCAEYLPAGLSIKAAFPLLYCDSLNTKLWSDVKDKGVLWQKWTHTEVKVRRTPHGSPVHNRTPALKWCSEMEVLQTRSSFLRRMVGLSYWQLRSAEIP